MAKRNVEVEFSLKDGITKGLAAINRGLGSVGDSLTSVKGLAVQAAAAFGLFKAADLFVKGVESAATFEQSLDKISAKTGITGDALQSLGADIRQVSQDASKTGEQGAAAFERLTAEGLSAADALKQLPTALDFATASSQGTAEAVGSLADNLDAFGLGADSFARAADVITAGALKGGTGVADLQKALQAVGPTARDLGLTLEQTTAALGTLAQNGLEGGKAGKALTTVFDQLRDPASKFRVELAKIGITSKDFNVVLAQLGKGGASTQAALNALGVQGTAAIKALSKDGGVALQQFTAQLGSVEGQTSKTAAIINQGLLASFVRLKESADAAVASFLQPILGPLSDEFDALSKTINEFAKSKAFEDLRTTFKQSFVEGLEAVKAFIKEFDFKEATESVKTFVKETGESFSQLKDSVGAIAEAVKLTAAAFSLAWNSIQTVTSSAVLGLTGTLSKFYGVLGLVSDRAKEISVNLRNVALTAKDETIIQFEQAKNAAIRLAGGVGAAAESTEKLSDAADKNADAVASMGPPYNPVIQKISQFVLAIKEKIKALGFVKPATEESDAAIEKSGFVVAELTQKNLELAQSLDAARDKFALFGDAAKLAAENAAINADISSKSAASFKEIQKGIADDIAARKRQSGAIRDVADATDEASQAQADYSAAVAADGGASSSIFDGLTENFNKLSGELAELRNVSESSVKDGLNRAAQGATISIDGMNNAINRARQQIEELGGQEKLDEIRKRTQDIADAWAHVEENARAANAAAEDQLKAARERVNAGGGDAAAQEKARHEAELADIAEKERVSGGTNRKLYAELIALENQYHQQQLANVRAEAQARVDSELGADREIASARAGTSSAPGGGGPSGAATPNAGNPLQPGGTVVQNVFNGPVVATGGQAGVRELARLLGPAIDDVNRNRR